MLGRKPSSKNVDKDIQQLFPLRCNGIYTPQSAVKLNWAAHRSRDPYDTTITNMQSRLEPTMQKTCSCRMRELISLKDTEIT
jgi:hypothetical protein